jgi:aminoglycoside phosphotransferase (APT) family kinase protein
MATQHTTGVIDPPEHLRIDPDSLEPWLTRHVEGFEGPVTIQQFDGGQSNPTYLLTAGSGQYVLRRRPPGELLPSAHQVDREYRVMCTLGHYDFPVPRTLAYCGDEDVAGTAFFVMAYQPGEIFWDGRLLDVQPERRRGIYESAIAALAKLHSLNPQIMGLGDYGKPKNYMQRQVRRWSKQYDASKTQDLPAMDKLIAWLPDNVPADTGFALVHGDFRLDNVIFESGGTQVLGVLDWELSTLGDPFADFSYFLMQWRMPAAFRGGLAEMDWAAHNIPSLSEAVELYRSATGASSFDNLNVYLAYNMFRLAAILQGVVKRGLEGNASSAQALEFEKSLGPLTEQAWAIAQGADLQ